MEGIAKSMFALKYLVHWLVAGGVVLLAIAGIIWWRAVYENPYNVYWGMLSNSLVTSSVTKHIAQTGGGNLLDQTITMEFGTPNLAYGQTTLQNSASKVTTETISTLKSDYVRYIKLEAKQPSKGTKAPDFRPVLGKWAKADASATGQSKTTPFFVQLLLGVDGGNLVPFADVPGSAQHQLLDMLHQNVVFNASFDDVQKRLEHGRPVYTYKVAVEPVAYVAFEKAFGSALGITALQNVDPNNYQGQPATTVELSIDAWSHRLEAVTYPGTNQVETYGSYGVPVRVSAPQKALSAAQLQYLLTHPQ